MRIVNIIGLVLVFVVLAVIGYYINEINEAKWAYWNNYDYKEYHYPDYYFNTVTFEAALLMMPFTIFFILAYIWNMIKVKTTSTRVFTIIGLSFSLIIGLINWMILVESQSFVFSESGRLFVIYHIITLAFFIVLLVQSVRYKKRNRSTASTNHIIDKEIV